MCLTGILKVEELMGKEDSMTDQASFADLEYQGKKRRTRREVFLERMESLVPWEKLEGRIRPHYFSSARNNHDRP